MKHCISILGILGCVLGDVYAAATKPIRTTPLVLSEGGTADNPAVFDGEGMVIDLGIDVSDHAWKKAADVWTSTPRLLGDLNREPTMAGQMAGLFVDLIPVTIPRDLEAEKARPDRKSRCYFSPDNLRPGQMGYTENGAIHFRWPAGVKPGSKPLILPPKPGMNCVGIACSHIVVRNITARYAGNDGFNIHGPRVGVRLENIKAFANADEGISAHETVQMDVVGAEVAWNGSAAGGVADVNDSVTTYRDCVVHDNAGAAFFFSGRSHGVTDTRIFNQARDFAIAKDTEFKKERITTP
jgi:hypothetical protein